MKGFIEDANVKFNDDKMLEFSMLSDDYKLTE